MICEVLTNRFAVYSMLEKMQEAHVICFFVNSVSDS